ncbi:uncharacterized protein LOC113930934 [Zalophus californianus]|uniref:Uncharacterized protein LOC113930934 n=1 Tax=Zalophus californianus TaxID=9704 RepID=A0A6J2E6M2_ZALCA|nr:uncharacterized protein LOC113930934 [Zalophus californianus]
MRGLLWCAKHDGIGGTRIKRLMMHRFENRRWRAGHAAGEPGCEVLDEGTAAGLSQPSLQSNKFIATLARSGLLLQRKQNQNKHLFAPPPRRFLNYRVGPRGAAHARQGTAPPLVRKYVGKIFAAATTIAGTNQSGQLRGCSMMPTGQSDASDRPPVPSVSDFSQSRHPRSLPSFSSALLRSPLLSAVTRRRGY